MIEPLTLHSTDQRGHIALAVGHIELGRYPTVSLDIEAEDNGYSTSAGPIWFAEADLLSFVAALQQVENSRSGSAELSSVSPDRCRLHISFRRALTVLGASLEVHSTRHVDGENPWHQRLDLEFPVDQGLLHTWIAWFQRVRVLLKA